jgi:hypothetical protein
LQRAFNRPPRGQYKGIKVEGGSRLSQSDADSLQPDQIAQLSVDQGAVPKEKAGWTFGVLNKQSSRLALVTKDSDEIRQGVIIQMTCQYYEAIVHFSLLGYVCLFASHS